jgi:hypothetical protein
MSSQSFWPAAADVGIRDPPRPQCGITRLSAERRSGIVRLAMADGCSGDDDDRDG